MPDWFPGMILLATRHIFCYLLQLFLVILNWRVAERFELASSLEFLCAAGIPVPAPRIRLAFSRCWATSLQKRHRGHADPRHEHRWRLRATTRTPTPTGGARHARGRLPRPRPAQNRRREGNAADGKRCRKSPSRTPSPIRGAARGSAGALRRRRPGAPPSPRTFRAVPKNWTNRTMSNRISTRRKRSSIAMCRTLQPSSPNAGRTSSESRGSWDT